MRLEGSVALVTGGGTGLGAEVARRLSAQGARVAVNWCRSRDQAEALVSELRAAGVRAVAVGADVRDEDAVARIVAETEAELGPVTLLVCAAGVTSYVAHDDLDALPAADWDRILGVNVIGAWNAVRAVVPSMRAAGAGSIVTVASDSAFTLEGSSIPYVVSKAGLVSLTQLLARALAPEIRVNAVAPGWMDTTWLDRYVPTEVRDAIREGREATVPVDDVTEEIVRLLADDGRTGEIVRFSVR